MSSCIRLKNIAFFGPDKRAELGFSSGVNVICGASDTGKSYLAESIDFMLGGSELRQIPQRTPYAEIKLDIDTRNETPWQFIRPVEGGHFKLVELNNPDGEPSVLNQRHLHDKVCNISGFLLDKTDLLGKRILKSTTKGTTQSLSFRNLARLIIVQEGEIQQTGSPFWGGQFTLKTPELATIKLLLTGIDDSHVVADKSPVTDNSGKLSIVNELISDLETEITDLGQTSESLSDQLQRLEATIEDKRDVLSQSQRELNTLLAERRELYEEQQQLQARLDEIENLLARFGLLSQHYTVDIERLKAIQESGSMFAHVEPVPCPLCGAKPDAQHLDESCEGDVDAIVAAASAEIQKIQNLQRELNDTFRDLRTEFGELGEKLGRKNLAYKKLDDEIQEAVSPQVNEMQALFSDLIEERSEIKNTFSLFERLQKLQVKKTSLEHSDGNQGGGGNITSGLPDSIAHKFSLKVSQILNAWNFPGDCLVHFDKEKSDFVIDGKPRGSRGKGLRAITHAAVTLGLLEYCQENSLPHPGFVVLDSPLLAYFKPENDDDEMLKGSDLKERFYEYLISHHKGDSQIIIIENQHPPIEFEDKLNMTVFTGNPNQGREGFL